MILVDTSVWIDHLRASDPDLAVALNDSQVLTHPFVIGELACGSLARRAEVLSLLHSLPRAAIATDEEALIFIERHQLMRRGIGYLDVHLLASTALEGTATLWTRDRRLAEVATELGLTHAPGGNGKAS
jgi:predicted nucleic acid-binding protein